MRDWRKENLACLRRILASDAARVRSCVGLRNSKYASRLYALALVEFGRSLQRYKSFQSDMKLEAAR